MAEQKAHLADAKRMKAYKMESVLIAKYTGLSVNPYIITTTYLLYKEMKRRASDYLP